jgi:hypothetical protein
VQKSFLNSESEHKFITTINMAIQNVHNHFCIVKIQRNIPKHILLLKIENNLSLEKLTLTCGVEHQLLNQPRGNSLVFFQSTAGGANTFVNIIIFCAWALTQL